MLWLFCSERAHSAGNTLFNRLKRRHAFQFSMVVWLSWWFIWLFWDEIDNYSQSSFILRGIAFFLMVSFVPVSRFVSFFYHASIIYTYVCMYLCVCIDGQCERSAMCVDYYALCHFLYASSVVDMSSWKKICCLWSVVTFHVSLLVQLVLIRSCELLGLRVVTLMMWLEWTIRCLLRTSKNGKVVH